MQQAHDDEGRERHTYRPRMCTGRWRWYWRCYPLIYPILIVLNMVERHWVLVALWTVLLFLVPLTLRGMTETRLVLSPEGIAYHTLAGTLRAAWADVDHVGGKPGWQYWGSQGLHLQYATWKPSRHWGWIRPRPRDYVALTSGMGPYWQAGLSDDLRRYLPWLWDPVGTAQGEMLPLGEDAARRGRKRFGLLMGAIFCGSILGGFLSFFLRNLVLGTLVTVILDLLCVLLVFRVTQRRP